ncbi:MAG: hypothetical protein M3P06_02470 [Acidobacteriota bacterium]|nr:hypothetical protein [Acidobacteriota bacterium]
MNSKRRAELQRKLSMGAVPRPPADLSDRIKADIPQYLQADVERARFSGSVAFSMRVAASILLLITTAFVTLRLLETEPEQTASFKARPQLVPAITQRTVAANTTTATAQPQPLGQEVRLDIAQEIAVPSAPPAAPESARQEQFAAASRRDERDDDRARSEGFQDWTAVQETAVVADAGEDRAESKIAEESAAGFSEPVQSVEVAQAAPPVDATPRERQTQTTEAAQKTRFGRRTAPAPAAAMAPPPSAAPPVAETITVTAGAPSLISTAQANTLSFRQKPEVFGISIDPAVFLTMKSALQSGKQPTAASVNVDALVNYFAGPPEKAPRRITLDVEASPAPVEADGDHAVLRFTIDTPRITVGPRESTPPAATEARIDIEIDPKAVASFHRIGGSASAASESILLHNLSVTGLYQLELHPHLRAKQHVATVRLSYRSVTDGKPQVLTRVVRGSDLARDWSRASRRHRLASLGAVWSESLKGAGARADVARRAKELATEKPKDTRARELANAASATAGDER